VPCALLLLRLQGGLILDLARRADATLGRADRGLTGRAADTLAAALSPRLGPSLRSLARLLGWNPRERSEAAAAAAQERVEQEQERQRGQRGRAGRGSDGEARRYLRAGHGRVLDDGTLPVLTRLWDRTTATWAWQPGYRGPGLLGHYGYGRHSAEFRHLNTRVLLEIASGEADWRDLRFDRLPFESSCLALLVATRPPLLLAGLAAVAVSKGSAASAEAAFGAAVGLGCEVGGALRAVLGPLAASLVLSLASSTAGAWRAAQISARRCQWKALVGIKKAAGGGAGSVSQGSKHQAAGQPP